MKYKITLLNKKAPCFIIKIDWLPKLNGSAAVFGLPIFMNTFIQDGWRMIALMAVTQILPVFL